MEEKDERVKIIRSYKIAAYLVKRGHKIVNIKKHRNFICDITNLPCNYRTVFAFRITDEFLKDYELIKEYQEKIDEKSGE